MAESSPLFRRAEIGEGFARLESLVIDERVPVVNIHGAPGSGKSAFARAFVDRRRSAFPGGVVELMAHGDLDVAELVRLPAVARALVVLDEVDRANISSLQEVLAWVREHRPLAQVITISRLNVSVGRGTPHLEMPLLPLGRVVELLVDGTASADRRRVERLAGLLEGNASAVAETSQRLASGVPVDRIIEWLERRAVVVARDPQGGELLPGSPARERIDAVVDEISDELIRDLAARPDRLYELNPRRFEELVAELYRRRGFEATLTPASGDEGVDVYVVRNDELGRTLWVVQAKRYAADRKVGAGVVRELLGTVHAKNASAGILVTTSFFQPGAVRVEQQFEYRIALRDYLGLQDMLRW